MVVIKQISAEETYAIRLETLRNGIDLPVQFSGDFDSETFHLGVFEDDELKGISSFMKTTNELFDTPQYQLRGMATLPNARGKGFGKLMLQYSFSHLRENKINTLWCNAREIALDFYLKEGFLEKGVSFEIQQIGIHYKLYKKIMCDNIKR
ncbi:MAG: GNAT superfamily N-acetyltransferase [Polaribacter sp.]|jgi:GNAT superfamily N-acetyltransferase